MKIRYRSLFLFATMIFCQCKSDNEIPFIETLTIGDEINNDWHNAIHQSINDSVQLHIAQTQDQLFLAVDFIEPDSTEYRWVELFLLGEKSNYRLHASGQLGEQRNDEHSNWTEDWEWGNNRQWEATRHGLNKVTNSVYIFSIAKDMLSADVLSFMVEVSIADKSKSFDQETKVIRHPNKSKRDLSSTWASYNLN